MASSLWTCIEFVNDCAFLQLLKQGYLRARVGKNQRLMHLPNIQAFSCHRLSLDMTAGRKLILHFLSYLEPELT